tara:strand:- start:10467 stop:10862 length:396 start_codon:yes stop_codon:yes gene_type:complete
MKNEGEASSKLQWNLNPKQWTLEKPTGEKPTGKIKAENPFAISFFFAIALLISFGMVSDNDLIITASVILPIFYLLSLCFFIIGFKRKKRDPNLRGKFLGVLSLLIIIPSTPLLLFLLAYGLVGELSGGCC